MDIETLLKVAQIATPVVLFFMGGLMTVLWFFIRGQFTAIGGNISRVEEGLRELETEFRNHEKNAPFFFVLRGDCLKNTAGFDKRLDQLNESLNSKMETLNQDIKRLIRHQGVPENA